MHLDPGVYDLLGMATGSPSVHDARDGREVTFSSNAAN